MSLLLRYWPLLLVYLWYNSLSILMMRTFHLMRSCLTLLVLPFDGVLILVSLLMSLQSSTICFSRLLVIPFGPSLICTLFLLRDVHFCMPLWLMLLWVFLPSSFVLWLRFIGVVLNHMVFSFLFLFIGFCYI